MQDKIKYIVIGLAILVILIIIIFLGLKVKSLEQERQTLQDQVAGLNQQVASITADNGRLQNELKDVSDALTSANAQIAELQQKYDALIQERDALANEISQLKAEKEKTAKDSIAAAQQVTPSLNDAYIANLLKQKADLEVRLSMMREELKKLKETNEHLILDKNNLTAELKNISRESQDVQQATVYNQKMVDSLTQELAREKMDKLETVKRLQSLKADNKQLRQQIKTLGDRKLSLEKKLAEMQEKNAALENSLASMELYVKQQMYQMGDISSRIQNARGDAPTAPAQPPKQDTPTGKKETIHLPPIVVRPQPSTPQTKNIGNDAHIISVDTDNNFVVVNVGKINGLNIGDTLNVMRNGQNVGLLKVIQTRERIAACDIAQEKSPLQVGDLVK